MMRGFAITCLLGLFVTETAAMAAILGVNQTKLRANCATKKGPQGPAYGNDKCRCVGMDNLKGYYATQENYHHVQRIAETGASCSAWDKGKHPKCRGSTPPQWCRQEWCYVDPCSCDIDVLPKQSTAGVEFQGSLAYWSYSTCGGFDFYSQGESPDACVNQKTPGACSAQSKCAWDGKQCAGKEIVETCKVVAKKDETVHGQDDCRCIGLGGKDVGKAFMYINDKDLVSYPPNVGATCQAWEQNSHPDCLKDGDKPAWCSAKWCFVDPCKCKTKAPPSAVMPANRDIRFQGKTAYWTYETCGSKDSWSSEHAGSYCYPLKTEASCKKLSKCAWNGKECMGKALVEICAKQEETGMLGVEAPLSGAINRQWPLTALILALGALVAA